MHVLLIPSWFPKDAFDASGVFFLDQAAALARAGNRVGVLAQYPVSLKDILRMRPSLESAEVDGVSVRRTRFIAALPKIPYGTFLLWKRAAARQFTAYLCRYGRPDVIHAHSALYAGAIAVRLGQKFGIPVVVTEHSSAFALNLLTQWELRLARAAFVGADACVAVSGALAGEVRRLLGDPCREVSIVPNVVGRRFSARPASSRGKQSEINRVLSVGSLDVNKAHCDLIVAFAAMLRRISSAELWIIGDGPERSSLVALSASLGIADRIRFLGYRPPSELPGLIAEADLLAISSQYETFGVVAAEALVMGKPVVATRCGGPEEIVTERDGVLVPVNAPMELAVALEDVIRNLDSFDPGDIALRARDRFGEEAVARQLSRIYSTLQPE